MMIGAETPSHMANYTVTVSAANIAPTIATAVREKVEVFGEPRMTKGHPCTLWDKEDIAHYKEMLKTSKELQIQLAELKDRMDTRMVKKGEQPEDIPVPQKGPDGNWLFPGEYFPRLADFPNADAGENFRRRFCYEAAVVSDLGILYALTGEEKYGEFARKLLLAFAHFTRYGKYKSYTPYSNIGITTDAFLEEGLKCTRYAIGYDLIYNLPSWTPEDRKRIRDDFFKPWISASFYPTFANNDPTYCHSAQVNNRGVFTSTAALIAGYATEDDELVNAALYGIRSTAPKDVSRGLQWPSPKDWAAATKDDPSKGLMTVHFAEPCLGGGMWVEGSLGYTFYAMGSMITAAEAAWHHDTDLYRHNNGIFKVMFDYPFLLGYPNLGAPSLNDSHGFNMAEGAIGRGFNCGPNLFEYGYRRYRDPRYLRMINNPQEIAYLASLSDPATQNIPAHKQVKSVRQLGVTIIGSAPPSLMYDHDPKEGVKGAPPLPPSINFTTIGFGVLRCPATKEENGINNLILSSGITIPHGHPDKLHIDLYALNNVLMPSPGVMFPYQDPVNKNWFYTTLAHNTLTVDEKPQEFLFSTTGSKAHADQLVYGPASTIGIQRAWTDSVYKAVTMDRAVFLTQNYVADLFGTFSETPHKYDLAWHIRGDLSSDLKLEAMKFPEPVAIGYNTLTNVKQATSDKTWAVTMALESHKAHLLAAGGTSTRIIVGDGLFTDDTLRGKEKTATAPTILERRENIPSTLYGNVLDLADSKDGYVKSVVQEGGLNTGYGLLKVTTVKGTDLCFASYRPGNWKAGVLESDALQALVLMDGQNVRSMYLGGGKVLKVAGAAIERSEPGLAYIEKFENGDYIVANPSPTDATVLVTLPALSAFNTFALNDKGQRTPVTNVIRGNTLTLKLNAGGKVICTRK